MNSVDETSFYTLEPVGFIPSTICGLGRRAAGSLEVRTHVLPHFVMPVGVMLALRTSVVQMMSTSPTREHRS